MPLRIDATAQGSVLSVKVVPNSSRDALAGLLGDALKIKVAKPPEGGQANQAVEALLARTLNIAPNRVSVIGGRGQSHKRVLIVGMDPPTVSAVLLPGR